MWGEKHSFSMQYTGDFGQWKGPHYMNDRMYGKLSLPTGKKKADRNGGRTQCCEELGRFFLLFMETSSLHGLVHIVTPGRTLTERVFWTACVALAVAGCLTIGLNTLSRYEQNPTVISLERDHQTWRTPLPTVTVCPLEPWNNSALAQYVNSAVNVTDKEGLLHFLRNLTVASYDTFKYMKHVPGNPLKSSDYQTFVFNHVLHWKEQFKPENVTTTGEVGATRNELVEFFTERGLCYSINSHLSPYSAFQYWAQNKWDIQPEGHEYLGNPISGEKCINFFVGFQAEVYMHWQGEAPDCTERGTPLHMRKERRRYATALATLTTAAVRELRPSQRGCRLPFDAPPLPTSPRYSYRLCRSECRRRLALALCGCAPFFYRRVDKDNDILLLFFIIYSIRDLFWTKVGRNNKFFPNFTNNDFHQPTHSTELFQIYDTPICNETQMLCLANHSDTLVTLRDQYTKKKMECGCLPMCEEVTYALEQHDEIFNSSGEAAIIRFGIKKYPYIRLKRDIIFGFADLLVAAGGTAGLFLGCSVLSFVEIVYFFTLRLFWYIIKCRSEKQNGKG